MNDQRPEMDPARLIADAEEMVERDGPGETVTEGFARLRAGYRSSSRRQSAARFIHNEETRDA